MIRNYGIPASLYPASLLVVCAVALWRGGKYERLAAFGLLAAWMLTFVAYRTFAAKSEPPILVVDLVLLALLVWIALKSPAYWPLLAAGFHLLAILTHVAKDLDRALGPWVYLSAQIIWGYLLAMAIGVGAWRHRLVRVAENDDLTDGGAGRA